MNPYLNALFRVDERSQRLFHPLFGDDLLPVPNAVVEVEVSEFREVGAAEEQATFGIDDAERSSLPEVLHAKRDRLPWQEYQDRDWI